MLQITSPVLFAAQHPTPWWLAGLILATWCLLPVIAGMLSAVRRDVVLSGPPLGRAALDSAAWLEWLST